MGARVVCIDPAAPTPLVRHLDHQKEVVSGDPEASHAAVAAADLIVCEGRPSDLHARQRDPDALRRLNPTAAIVAISPFGQTGPNADDPASDLTLFVASGIARMLTGQVDDLAEAPIRPVGEQSAFIDGIAAACAGMHAVLAKEPGAVVDVSIQEALATLAITELARAASSGRSWSRKRLTDGNGATVCILPARDGYAAISPRDDHQWAAWVGVMGEPSWTRPMRWRKSGSLSASSLPMRSSAAAVAKIKDCCGGVPDRRQIHLADLADPVHSGFPDCGLHIGVDDPGGQAEDPHTRIPALQRNRVGQHREPGLGRAIGAPAFERAMRGA